MSVGEIKGFRLIIDRSRDIQNDSSLSTGSSFVYLVIDLTEVIQGQIHLEYLQFFSVRVILFFKLTNGLFFFSLPHSLPIL